MSEPRCLSAADGHRCELSHEHEGRHGADFGGSEGFVTWADDTADEFDPLTCEDWCGLAVDHDGPCER